MIIRIFVIFAITFMILSVMDVNTSRYEAEAAICERQSIDMKRDKLLLEISIFMRNIKRFEKHVSDEIKDYRIYGDDGYGNSIMYPVLLIDEK